MSLLSFIFFSLHSFAGNNLCVVDYDGLEITQGDELPYEVNERNTNILQRMSKGDYYFCDIGNNERRQRLPLSADSRRNRSGNIYVYPIGKPKRLDENPEVYLDGDPGQDISVLSKPGRTWKDAKRNPGLKVAYPNVASDEHRLFLKDLDYRFVPEGEEGSSFRRSAELYVVENTPEAMAAYKSGDYDHPGIKVGWIDQRHLRSTPFPEQYKVKKEEPCEKVEVEKESTEENLKELMKAAEEAKDIESARKSVVEDLFNKRCFDRRPDPSPVPTNALYGDITKGMGKFLRRSPLPSDNSYPGLTADDVKLIRLIAFTVWGEMRDQTCATRYRKAVARIALNRAESIKRKGYFSGGKTCKAPPGKGPRSKYFPSAPLGESMACALGATEQFHVWDGDNLNYDKFKCLDENRIEEEAFKDALGLAFDIVSDKEAFKLETRELEGVMYYTSKGRAKSDRMKEYPNVLNTRDGPLDMGRCMRFWYDPKYALRPWKYNQLIVESFARSRPRSQPLYETDYRP